VEGILTISNVQNAMIHTTLPDTEKVAKVIPFCTLANNIKMHRNKPFGDNMLCSPLSCVELVMYVKRLAIVMVIEQ
jgi:hypothetical protein